MDWILELANVHGYLAMFLAAFLAGSFVPFSSETVMGALMIADCDPWLLLVYASVGNTLGGFFNYMVGRMGKIEWIERYLHVSPEQLSRAQRFMAGHGAWMGFFSFIPILGSAITIALGLMRSNVLLSFFSMALGKTLRYVVIAILPMLF